MYNPHVLKVDTGYILVGYIPVSLAFVSQDEKTLTDEFIEEQLRLPAKYRSIKDRVFKTELDALNALKGYYK